MQPSEAILIVLLVLLILVVAWQGYSYSQAKKEGLAGPAAASPETFAGPKEEMLAGPSPMDLDRAQREAWQEATQSFSGDGYDPSKDGCPADSLQQFHAPGSSLNYQEALVNTVVDDRMRTQHANWHAEVAAKSQTAMTVDDMDEAVAMSLPRTGITAFRMSAPKQYNPLQITELDAHQMKQHATGFRFGER